MSKPMTPEREAEIRKHVEWLHDSEEWGSVPEADIRDLLAELDRLRGIAERRRTSLREASREIDRLHAERPVDLNESVDAAYPRSAQPSATLREEFDAWYDEWWKKAHDSNDVSGLNDHDIAWAAYQAGARATSSRVREVLAAADAMSRNYDPLAGALFGGNEAVAVVRLQQLGKSVAAYRKARASVIERETK